MFIMLSLFIFEHLAIIAPKRVFSRSEGKKAITEISWWKFELRKSKHRYLIAPVMASSNCARKVILRPCGCKLTPATM